MKVVVKDAGAKFSKEKKLSRVLFTISIILWVVVLVLSGLSYLDSVFADSVRHTLRVAAGYTFLSGLVSWHHGTLAVERSEGAVTRDYKKSSFGYLISEGNLFRVGKIKDVQVINSDAEVEFELTNIYVTPNQADASFWPSKEKTIQWLTTQGFTRQGDLLVKDNTAFKYKTEDGSGIYLGRK